MRHTRRGTSTPAPDLRAGFTSIELLVAMVVTLILMSIAAPLYRAQLGSIKDTSGRAEAARSAAFGSDAITQDLRNAGVGAFDGQPVLVRGAQNAISFNADMVTSRVNDPIAVFSDPTADSASVAALRSNSPVTLPNSGQSYPAVSYASNAETISYYITTDTATSPIAGTQLGVLYRRVNALPAQVVSRNIVLYSGDPIFRYFKRSATGSISEVPGASLPLYHAAPRHGTPADTGAVSLIDSVAIVRVKLVTVFKNPRGGYSVDTLQRNIRIANQGLLQRAQCGEAPLSPGAPTATIQLIAGLNAVQLTWSSSSDELSGERDVEMYAVYRRLQGAATWGEPMVNVPGAGTAVLSYLDNAVSSGDTYEYAITALDCTPVPSPITPLTTILVP